MKRIRVFTDGACSANPGPGGWAAVIFLKDKNIKLSGGYENTTNNRMELIAIVNALEELFRRKKSKENIVIEIRTDSAYVTNALDPVKGWLFKIIENDWITESGNEVKHVDLWKRLLNVLNKQDRKRIKIEFIKVKGHSGIVGNEMANDLAVEEVNKIKSKILG